MCKGESYNELGKRCILGIGVEINEGKALDFFLKGAEEKDPKAIHNLGVYYESKKSLELAARYYKEAADLGNADAAYLYGRCILFGEGVYPRDYKLANKYFEMASDAGHPGASYNLSLSYRHGEGVMKDSKTANILLELAELQGFYDEEYQKTGYYKDINYS